MKKSLMGLLLFLYLCSLSQLLFVSGEQAGTSWRSTYVKQTDLDGATEEGQLPETDRYKLLVQEALPINCYQFTWLGEYDTKNKTESCSESHSLGLPCFEPLVWTDGEYKANGPDLDQLEELCNSGGALDGASCNPLCVKGNNDVCVKMTYFRRDKGRTIANYTSFCGQGVMISDGSKAITQDSCHIQTNVNGYDVESCFCDKDRCNSGNNIKVINLLFLLGIVFLTTLSPLLAPVINL